MIVSGKVWEKGTKLSFEFSVYLCSFRSWLNGGVENLSGTSNWVPGMSYDGFLILSCEIWVSMVQVDLFFWESCGVIKGIKDDLLKLVLLMFLRKHISFYTNATFWSCIYWFCYVLLPSSQIFGPVFHFGVSKILSRF